MTEKEKQEIIEELKKQMMEERETRPHIRMLLPTYKKWFKGKNGREDYNSIMDKVVYSQSRVWDSVRAITANLLGVKSVVHIKDAQIANEIADRLCQEIYDIALQLKREGNHDGTNKTKIAG